MSLISNIIARGNLPDLNRIRIARRRFGSQAIAVDWSTPGASFATASTGKLHREALLPHAVNLRGIGGVV
jgi:hypothetical protein